jgi:hypothetical protein
MQGKKSRLTNYFMLLGYYDASMCMCDSVIVCMCDGVHT